MKLEIKVTNKDQYDKICEFSAKSKTFELFGETYSCVDLYFRYDGDSHHAYMTLIEQE